MTRCRICGKEGADLGKVHSKCWEKRQPKKVIERMKDEQRTLEIIARRAGR